MLGPAALAGAGWAPHALPRGGPTWRALFAGLARQPMAAGGWRCAAVRGKACYSAAPAAPMSLGEYASQCFWRRRPAKGSGHGGTGAGRTGGGDGGRRPRRAGAIGAIASRTGNAGAGGETAKGRGHWSTGAGAGKGDAGQGQGAGEGGPAGEGAARPHSAAKTSACAPPGAPARRRLWEYVARLVDTVLVNPLVGRVAGNFLALLYDVAACRALRRKPSLHCAGRGAGAINSIGLKES